MRIRLPCDIALRTWKQCGTRTKSPHTTPRGPYVCFSFLGVCVLFDHQSLVAMLPNRFVLSRLCLNCALTFAQPMSEFFRAFLARRHGRSCWNSSDRQEILFKSTRISHDAFCKAIDIENCWRRLCSARFNKTMGGLLSIFAAHFGGEWWLQRQPFTPQQLSDYQDCTFFTRQDIVRLYRRFYALNPSKVGDFPSRTCKWRAFRFLQTCMVLVRKSSHCPLRRLNECQS